MAIGLQPTYKTAVSAAASDIKGMINGTDYANNKIAQIPDLIKAGKLDDASSTAQSAQKALEIGRAHV